MNKIAFVNKKTKQKKTHYGLENRSLSCFTETLHKLAYTWAERYFQINQDGTNDTKRH